LNALDENGQPIYDEEKKTLLDRVEFHESDLLSYCRENGIQLERIVGCIPQVIPELSYVLTYYAGYYTWNLYKYAMCKFL
jgi:hypothetical protein